MQIFNIVRAKETGLGGLQSIDDDSQFMSLSAHKAAPKLQCKFLGYMGFSLTWKEPCLLKTPDQLICWNLTPLSVWFSALWAAFGGFLGWCVMGWMGVLSSSEGA